jgi:hypothetical protein
MLWANPISSFGTEPSQSLCQGPKYSPPTGGRMPRLPHLPHLPHLRESKPFPDLKGAMLGPRWVITK